LSPLATNNIKILNEPFLNLQAIALKQGRRHINKLVDLIFAEQLIGLIVFFIVPMPQGSDYDCLRERHRLTINQALVSIHLTKFLEV
jgi:hypothetical protein